MLLDCLRFLRGWVCFSVSGKYPERLINITVRHGVSLWSVERQGDGFTACMYRSDYLRIRPLARGAGVRLRLRGKGGLPVHVYRCRDRVGVLFGACAFLLSVFVMSLFIWSIDITGLNTVSYSEMQSLLRDNGLYVGAFKPLLDDQQVARSIMLQKHEIGWMAVNVTGSYVSVEVKEEYPAPEVYEIGEPCNIKASADGVILRIAASQGDTVITEGSGVTEGQLLVSGVMGDELGGVRLVHADASVIARTTHSASFSMPETLTVLTPTGETAERKLVSLLGLELPYQLGSVDSPYAVFSESASAPAPLDVTLPIQQITERVCALKKQESVLSENSAKELLIRQAELYELFSLSDCTVTGREYRLISDSGVYTLYADYICEEDIARADPIGTDENTDLSRPEPASSEGEEQ